MKIGFTGTRQGMTKAQKLAFMHVMDKLPEVEEFHHGDCIGADSDAHDLLRKRHHIVVHPPSQTWARARKKGHEWRAPLPFLVRNQAIVNETDQMIAVPDGPERIRSGTWATVRYARRKGKKVLIINPDGALA